MGKNIYFGEKMQNLINDFSTDLMSGQYLVIMPISRFVLENKLKLGKFIFYPAGEINTNELRVVPNKALDIIGRSVKPIEFEGQDLRELKSGLTGISEEVFNKNVTVAFTVNINWERFLRGTHESDLLLIHNLSQKVEKVIDLIRFYFCRFDLSNTLLGQVGTWDGSNGFSGALLYNLSDNESYIIGGSVVTHCTVQGIGLELENSQILSIKKHPLMETEIGEVGNIAKMGLNLNSGIFEANNVTTKFIRAMNLLEFLSYPYDYKKFADVKKEISCHVAKDKNEYDNLLNRFFELTSKKDKSTGELIGYRTKIIHLGVTLEEILSNEEDIIKLLLELQKYISIVIEDMIQNLYLTWEEFIEYRNQLKINLEIKNK